MTETAETAHPPLFMFGMERSGTTLMSMMLGAHPDIAVPLATTGMWFEFHCRLDEFAGLREPAQVARLVDAVLGHERIRLWRADLDREQILRRTAVADFASVVAAFHAEYARLQGKAMWGNIDIATLDNMHLVNRWFPAARFLHIVRDGRDVAISNQSMPYGPGNIAECARAWRQRLLVNLRMGDVLGPERYLAFRYESLILEPETTLKRICSFLGVPFSEQMLAWAETVDARVPDDKLWLWPELKSPPNDSRVGRWRTEMSENQRLVFEREAAGLLRELGYETWDSPPKRLGALLLEVAYALDRGGRSKRLLAKFGIRPRTQLERAAKQRQKQT